jgi:hypothetical protein
MKKLLLIALVLGFVIPSKAQIGIMHTTHLQIKYRRHQSARQGPLKINPRL